MSRLTYPQRLGVLLTGIIMLLVVIVVALLPPRKASVPTYEAKPAVHAPADTTRSAKPKRTKKTRTEHKPAPAPRNPLDETF